MVNLLSHLTCLDKVSFSTFRKALRYMTFSTESVTKVRTHHAFLPSQSFWAVLRPCTKQS